MKEPSQFELIYDTLGYSPGGSIVISVIDGVTTIGKVTTISRSKLRHESDEKKLIELNNHPLMIQRDHSIEIED